MRKFEYKRESNLSINQLNDLGEMGWELVSVNECIGEVIQSVWFYFKREML